MRGQSVRVRWMYRHRTGEISSNSVYLVTLLSVLSRTVEYDFPPVETSIL